MVNFREKYGQTFRNLLKIEYLERWVKFCFHIPLSAGLDGSLSIEVVVC